MRYCLDCSAKTGYLVERTCPALERQREAKRVRAKAKAKANRARKRRRKEAGQQAKEARVAARRKVAGDLGEELRRLWPTALRLSQRETLPAQVPTLSLRSRNDGFTSGCAWPSKHKIHLSVGLEDDRAGAQGTLAHEICHLLTTDGEPWHGPQFWRILVELVSECYSASITFAEVMSERTKYERQKAVESSIRSAIAE